MTVPGGTQGKEPTMTEQMDNQAAPAEAAPSNEIEVSAPDAAAEDRTGPESAPPPPAINRTQLEGRVIEAISSIFDPEIPVNIYELGLIYDIEITQQADVAIDMTLTSPACPVAESLPGDVKNVVAVVDGVGAVDVRLVWDPPWTPDRMTEAAKLELGFM